jgi:hypothetical protein
MPFLDRDEGFCAGTKRQILSTSFSTQQLENRLDQAGKLRVQVGQGVLQKFAVARVLRTLELLEHALAGQQQALPVALAGKLIGSQMWLGWDRS